MRNNLIVFTLTGNIVSRLPIISLDIMRKSIQLKYLIKQEEKRFISILINIIQTYNKNKHS